MPPSCLPPWDSTEGAPSHGQHLNLRPSNPQDQEKHISVLYKSPSLWCSVVMATRNSRGGQLEETEAGGTGREGRRGTAHPCPASKLSVRRTWALRLRPVSSKSSCDRCCCGHLCSVGSLGRRASRDPRVYSARAWPAWPAADSAPEQPCPSGGRGCVNTPAPGPQAEFCPGPQSPQWLLAVTGLVTHLDWQPSFPLWDISLLPAVFPHKLLVLVSWSRSLC